MNAEVEQIIDHMYNSWLDYAEKTGKKKKHPSRETYGDIIKHAQAWNIAVKELEKEREKNE